MNKLEKAKIYRENELIACDSEVKKLLDKLPSNARSDVAELFSRLMSASLSIYQGKYGKEKTEELIKRLENNK